MLPEKLHSEQVFRYHNLLQKYKKFIDVETNIKKKQSLSLLYFELTQLGEKLDNFIEFTLKLELDRLEIKSNIQHES